MNRALITLALFLSGCAVAVQPTADVVPSPATAETHTPAVRSDLPDLGLAPELENEVWLNTGAPLRLADLGGKVVLLDMWTFG